MWFPSQNNLWFHEGYNRNIFNLPLEAFLHSLIEDKEPGSIYKMSFLGQYSHVDQLLLTNKHRRHKWHTKIVEITLLHLHNDQYVAVLLFGIINNLFVILSML